MNPHLRQLSRKPSPRLAALRELADARLTAEVKAGRQTNHRGVEQLAVRQAHNLEAVGSSPTPATIPCAWCASAQTGDPVEIPKLSAAQCAGHLGLNREWHRRINRTPFGEEHTFPALRDEIAGRGLEIALRVRGGDHEPPQAEVAHA